MKGASTESDGTRWDWRLEDTSVCTSFRDPLTWRTRKLRGWRFYWRSTRSSRSPAPLLGLGWESRESPFPSGEFVRRLRTSKEKEETHTVDVVLSSSGCTLNHLCILTVVSSIGKDPRVRGEPSNTLTIPVARFFQGPFGGGYPSNPTSTSSEDREGLSCGPSLSTTLDPYYSSLFRLWFLRPWPRIFTVYSHLFGVPGWPLTPPYVLADSLNRSIRSTLCPQMLRLGKVPFSSNIFN